MALMNCPECGKENVSDSAIFCPACGFGIKSYVDKKIAEEIKEILREAEIKNVPMPKEPKTFNGFFGLAIFFGLCTLGCCFQENIMDGLFIIFLMLAATVWMIIEGSRQYGREMDKYKLAITNFERYQEKIIEEKEQRALEEKLRIKCPLCKSTNIARISTLNRAASIIVNGVASNKIGKQFKCRNCKYIW